jgi:hypothetical protein
MIREINTLILNLKRRGQDEKSGGYSCDKFNEYKWYSPGNLPRDANPVLLRVDPSDLGKGYKAINALVLQACCEWAYVRPYNKAV